MKRGKKIALIAIIVVVALAGTIGGVALAQSGDEEATTTPETARFAYLERVCEIYQEKTGVAIDADTLKDSLCQAGDEQREQVRNQFQQRLIDEGILTEEQLTKIEEWLQAKPDVLTEEFKEWVQSRPDDLPGRLGFINEHGNRIAFGFGYHLGKGIGEGSGGWCQQGNGAE
jgi:hypothetical protein